MKNIKCTCDAGHTCPACKALASMSRRFAAEAAPYLEPAKLRDHLSSARAGFSDEFTRQMPAEYHPMIDGPAEPVAAAMLAEERQREFNESNTGEMPGFKGDPEPDSLTPEAEAVYQELKRGGGRPFSELDDTGRYRMRLRGGTWISVCVDETEDGTAYRWTRLDTLRTSEKAEPDALFFGPLRHGWIPVEWGLPDDSTQVLCVDCMANIGTGFLDGDDWFYDYNAEPRDVSHWQPLPESPV